MTMESWSPIYLSLKCGILSACLNLPWGIFWGWLLGRREFRGKVVLQTVLYLPLVLPPVLTGYFLLSVLSRNALVGKFLFDYLGIQFVLDWKGAVVAAAVVSSPFMIETVKQAILAIDARLELIARSLGASPARVFRTITLPLARRGIIAGFFLVLARSLGEFGATIMLVGNIPGKTQTVPLAIFNKVFTGEEQGLWPLVVAAIVFSYLGLAITQRLVTAPHSSGKI